MTPAKIYPFSIPAGGSFPLLVIGDYCKILTCSGPLEIDGDTFGNIGPILAGQGVQDAPFHRLVLNDKSGATNNGTILIADNAFIDDRITGSVEIIDGGKNRTISNSAFAWVLGCGAFVGQYSRCQLYNPPGSGKRLILKSYAINMPVAGSVYMHSINVSLTSASNPAIVNAKLPGGIAPSSIGRFEQSASLTAAPLGFDLLVFNAAEQKRVTLQEPIVINPGWGVMAECAVLNTALNFVAEWTEEAIL